MSPKPPSCSPGARTGLHSRQQGGGCPRSSPAPAMAGLLALGRSGERRSWFEAHAPKDQGHRASFHRLRSVTGESSSGKQVFKSVAFTLQHWSSIIGISFSCITVLLLLCDRYYSGLKNTFILSRCWQAGVTRLPWGYSRVAAAASFPEAPGGDQFPQAGGRPARRRVRRQQVYRSSVRHTSLAASGD